MSCNTGISVPTHLTAVLLLLLHAWLVAELVSQWSATYNEPAHIVAGLVGWHSGVHDFYHVNPPLPRMVSTAALVNEPGISLEAMSRIRHQHGGRQEYEVGVFFADTNSLDFHRILCRARLAGIVWVTVGGWLIWRWATQLAGEVGGLTALGLWTFDPTVTAHAALVTGDIPATVMGLAATYHFRRFVMCHSWLNALIVGQLLGACLLCKFTMVLLLPAWVVGWIVMGEQRRDDSDGTTDSASFPVGKIAVIVVTSWLVLGAGYSFRGIGAPLGDMQLQSASLRKACDLVLSGLPSPVPVDYIQGIDTQQRDFEGEMKSYLCGEWRDHGWWYYYCYAFIVKTPAGHLGIYCLALTCSVVAVGRGRKIPPLLWGFPILLISVASAKSGFTSHFRYILPAFPFIMMLVAWAFSVLPVRVRTACICLVSVLMLWSAASMLAARPHLLGYFNEAAGGRSGGWRHLADSNCDWGQDWILLRDWLADHPDVQPIRLALKRHVDSQVYLRRQYPLPRKGMPGYVVVDVANLTREYQWLQKYPIIDQIGSSIFVIEVSP